MPIVRKIELKRHIEELEKRFKKLREAVEGQEPNTNVYDQYHNNSDQFVEEFTELSTHDIQYAVDDFKNVLGVIRKVNSFKAPKLKR